MEEGEGEALIMSQNEVRGRQIMGVINSNKY
jgi:hypothetical protein